MKLRRDEKNTSPEWRCKCNHKKSTLKRDDLEGKILLNHDKLLAALEKYADKQPDRKEFTLVEIFYALSYNVAVELNTYFQFLY